MLTVLFIIVCRFVFFLLVIVLILLRFTAYDYPSGLFKLFLSPNVLYHRNNNLLKQNSISCLRNKNISHKSVYGLRRDL